MRDVGKMRPAERATSGFRPAAWAWLGIAALFATYFAVFALTRGEGLLPAIWRAAYNVIPAIPLVFGFHALLASQVWPRRLGVALTAQVPLALAFGFAWYLGIIVLRDLPGNWMQSAFEVRPFVPIAFVWQMFQGTSLYAAVALGSLALHLSQKLAAKTMDSPAHREKAGGTLLVRTGNEHTAIDHDAILRISGAGDYAEIHLRGRTILSTTSLGEFEKRLPETEFIRAHRSHIVRLGAIARSEPAGNGRTTLHLVDGSTLQTSRSGTQALRAAAA